MASSIVRRNRVRTDRLPLASPHGILYALAFSILLWAMILALFELVR